MDAPLGGEEPMISSPVNRRIFLQRAFAFSAAASLGGCGRGASVVALTQTAPIAPATTQSGRTTEILMVGDWGWSGNDSGQSAVAIAMQLYVARQGLTVDALLFLGDNLYDDLPGGVTSSLWQTKFEQMYPQSVFNCPAYAVLGNHDYQNAPQSKVEAELAYAATGTSRWTMPSPSYTFKLPTQNPLVTFLALDSNTPDEPANPPPPNSSFFTPTEEQASAQLQWLSQQLQQPLTTPFLVVMAHHPVYSDGTFGDNGSLVKNLDPMLRQHGVHLYLAGHNHDLEHLEFAGHPTSFVGSGGGGAWLTAGDSAPARGPYCKESHGFTHLTIGPDLMTLKHIDEAGTVVHAFTKTPSGTVTILS
jgi:tartrate-resistant acid phosphatase type 5